MPLAAFALRTHCWLILSLLSITTPTAFSAELLPSQSILVSPILCHSFLGRGLAIFLSSDPATQALNQSTIQPTEKLRVSNLLLPSESISLLDAIQLWRISASATTVLSLLLMHIKSFLVLLNVLPSLPLRENTGGRFFN